MEQRILLFNKLKDHPWYSRLYKKLSKSDLAFIEGFISEHDKLPVVEFERAATNLFIDTSERPKRHKEIVELLICANSMVRNLFKFF